MSPRAPPLEVRPPDVRRSYAGAGRPGRLRRKLAVMGVFAGAALCVEGWFAWTHRAAQQPVGLGSDMAMVLAVRDRILAAGLAHAPKD